MSTKRILILGGNGMLGHALHYYLNQVSGFDVITTVRERKWLPLLQKFGVVKYNIDVTNLETIDQLVENNNFVINAIGIIKQKQDVKRNDFIEINGLLPHRLAAYCQARGARLIHISSDCVFTGDRGNYSEDDVPDASDDYGYSKAVGEVRYCNHLTLRTSIIGPELKTTFGLLEWFLKTDDSPVRGFSQAIWSGVTTSELSRVIIEIIQTHPQLKGLYNIGLKTPVNKFDLLKIINQEYKLGKEIVEYDAVRIDRSLDTSQFRNFSSISISPIKEQLQHCKELRNIMNQ
jgi:dTDP-4-dehydrorhamnose reductase